jgi:hypothetical protein
MNMPQTTLSNGIVVANFSSPHTFNFEDGSVIERCDSDRVKLGSLKATEVESEGIKGTIDINLKFELSESVEQLLNEAEKSGVDIYIVPFPVLGAIKEAGRLKEFPKARVIRVKNRETKEIFIDKFCR